VAVDPQTLLVAGADRVHVPDPHVKWGVVVEGTKRRPLRYSRDRFFALSILSRIEWGT